MPSQIYIPDRFNLSHSSRQRLRGCQRLFEFSKFFLAPMNVREDDTSNAAGAGRSIHSGFQTYLATQDRDRAIFETAINYPVEITTNPRDDRSMEACYSTVTFMIDNYKLQEYELATIRVGDEIRPCVEVPFEIELVGFSLSKHVHIPIYYIGYIDIILFNKLTEEYEDMDIKTHRKEQKDLTALYKFNDQVLPYAYVLRHMFSDNITELTTTYLSVYLDLMKPTLDTYTFRKTQQDMQDWALGLVDDMVRCQQYYDANFWPRNHEKCSSTWGKKMFTCKYFNICHEREPEIVQHYLGQGADLEELIKQKNAKPFVPWISFPLDLRGAVA